MSDAYMFFEVAGKPVAKARPRMGTWGVYTPAKTTNWERHIKIAARKGMGNKPTLLTPVGLVVDFHMPIPKSYAKSRSLAAQQNMIYPTKRPDLDNLVKSILDGMNKIVFNDDAQVVKLTCSKHYSVNPRVVIRVLNLEKEVN